MTEETAVVRWRKIIYVDQKTKRSAYQNVICMVVGFERMIPMLDGAELDVVDSSSEDLVPVTYHDGPYPYERALMHFQRLAGEYGATDAAKIALGLIKPPRFKRRRT